MQLRLCVSNWDNFIKIVSIINCSRNSKILKTFFFSLKLETWKFWLKKPVSFAVIDSFSTGYFFQVAIDVLKLTIFYEILNYKKVMNDFPAVCCFCCLYHNQG